MENSVEKMRELVLERVNENDFIRSLEIEFEELTAEHTLARMPFKKCQQNPYGTMHGGILYSLADIVAGTTACMTGHMVTTVNGNFNYMRPVSDSEYVHIEVSADKIGKTLVSYSCKLSDDRGRLVNTASFTFFKMHELV